MSKNRTIANLGTGFVNITDTGTEGTKVASGTTAQRGSTAGQFRFNTTTNLAEYYTGTDFKSIDTAPTISSISPTTQSGANANVVITGNGFATGATVKFIGTDGTQYNSPSVTVNSATQITATTPSSPLPASKEPYDIRVTNQSNLFGTLDDALDAGGVPAWTTASGNLGSIADNATGTHFTLAATDPDGTAVTFTESGGNLSGAGLSLSSAGVISGDPNDVSNPTTVSFDVNANSGNDSTLRSFNIIISKPTITVGSVATQLASSGDTYKLSTQGYYLVTTNADLNVYVDLWGAGGGTATNNASSPASSHGSAGGHAYGQITLLNGTSYVLLIGQGGRPTTNASMFPDGGANNHTDSNRGCGGGSTRFGLYTQSGFNLTNSASNYNNTNAVYQLIAGGGGGGSHYATGSGTLAGYGGGTNGASGGGYFSSDGASSPGGGGTQSAGGAGGTGGRLSNGSAGAKYQGGTGTGAGGGGGYYGGGGSAGYYSQGGGGSGFINSSSGLLSNTGFQTASTYNVAPAGTRSNRLNGTEGNGGNHSSNSGVAPDGGVVFTLV